MIRARLSCICVLAAAVVMSGRAAAAPPTVEECLAASEASLKSADEHKLRAERGHLVVCAASSCPAEMREECASRIEDINRKLPSIVFDAKDGAGSELTLVRISMDGELLAGRIDGTALAVDPGEHRFTFEAAGRPPMVKTLLVREGERDRRETVLFDVPGGATPKPLLAPHRGRLVVRAAPEDAITLDGKPVGTGQFEGDVPSGAHALRLTAPGKTPYQAQIVVQEGQMRTLNVTLDAAPRVPAWVWITGAAVAVAGASVGAYFLFKPSDTTIPAPQGKLGGVQLAGVPW
jgi:hypothetical protein